MNLSTTASAYRWFGIRFGLLLSFLLAVSESPAAIYTFSQGNSVASADSAVGLVDYKIDGVDQLVQQSFFYRVGTGGQENSVDTLSAPAVTARTSGDGYTLVYDNSSVRFTVTYWMLGGDPGSGSSALHVDWLLQNLTGSAIDFHLFQYADFNLGGTALDQSATFAKIGPPIWNRLTQTDGTMALTNNFQIAKAISRVQTGDAAGLLASLTDGTSTTLDGTSTWGSGNLAYAAQWDISLGANGSPTQSAANNELVALSVPEPSSLTLLSSAFAVLVLARQRQIRLQRGSHQTHAPSGFKRP